MISRFYCPGLVRTGEEVALPVAAAHHALKVLRLVMGDPLTLFDGSGGELSARLEIRGHQAYAIQGRWQDINRESPLPITLVQSLVSNDKMDWTIQKAVELGVVGIVPLAVARTTVRLNAERADKRLEHWRKIVIAACEQCGRNRLPFITPVQNVNTYLAENKNAMHLIFEPGGVQLQTVLPTKAFVPIHLLIGPEGGWNKEEQALFQRAGCIGIGLGPRILRTETAGLAALAALQTITGDF